MTAAVRSTVDSGPLADLFRLGNPRCAVVAQSGFDPDGQMHRMRPWLDRLVPVLTVHVEPGGLVVGPVSRPGVPGCAACAGRRRRIARENNRAFERLLADAAPRLREPQWTLLTGPAVDLAADLVTGLVARIADGSGPSPVDGAFLLVDLASLRVTRHEFRADPQCPVCGPVSGPAGSADRPAPLVLQARPKSTPQALRVRDADPDALRARYVDGVAGLVTGLYRRSDVGFPMVVSASGQSHGALPQVSAGRQLDYRSCELAAIAEAVERHGGARSPAAGSCVRGSYAGLRDGGLDALDPATLGLHDPAEYARDGFPFQPYHPDLVMNWVWGWTLRTGSPVLVPATYAFYPWYYATGDRPFAFEISNGCAVGGCLEEAVLHGLLEVAERDAFLLTWYARLPAPRIDLDAAADRTVPLMVERLERLTGYAVSAFDITVEQGIPCVWAVAVDEPARPGRPRTLSAAGSHLDPDRAVRNALLELAQTAMGVDDKLRVGADRMARMMVDPYEVRVMEDHQLRYSAPDARDRLAFLLDQTRRVPLAAGPAGPERRPPRPDLTDDLRDTAERYHRTGLDVVVVDQTTDEHRAGGLCCVKVIVPGTLSMTFGHHARRLHGLDRVRTVSHTLGYTEAPLRPDQLNLDPHPFP